MRKIKKDLVSKKKPIESKKVENKKAGKVADLAPKAKNLPSNIKKESAGAKKDKKIGEKSSLPISLKLKASKKK